MEVRIGGEEVEAVENSFAIFGFEWDPEVSHWLEGSSRDFSFLSWSIISLQCCVSFYCTVS